MQKLSLSFIVFILVGDVIALHYTTASKLSIRIVNRELASLFRTYGGHSS